MNEPLELTVSEFVTYLNQTLEYAYGSVVIYGELANFHVNRGRWVYFDLKDENAKVSFFSNVHQLPGPLEDGMLLKVRGQPRLHPQYGFSIVASEIIPSGYGTIKRVADLLRAKLAKEGLFDEERKRPLPPIPSKVGLIASFQSAAYQDFVKIINQRWVGLEIECLDVLVQGEQAPAQLINAINYFSGQAHPPDVLVLTRGGGSPEDLAVFNHEQLTRAIAACRIPTLVAIGHEKDVSLAELAADKRASTPSNAAELLVPDKNYMMDYLKHLPAVWQANLEHKLQAKNEQLKDRRDYLTQAVKRVFSDASGLMAERERLLKILNPKQVLDRGYAIVRQSGHTINGRGLWVGSIVEVEMAAVNFAADIQSIKRRLADDEN